MALNSAVGKLFLFRANSEGFRLLSCVGFESHILCCFSQPFKHLLTVLSHKETGWQAGGMSPGKAGRGSLTPGLQGDDPTSPTELADLCQGNLPVPLFFHL